MPGIVPSATHIIISIITTTSWAGTVWPPYFRSELESFVQGHSRVSSWVRLSDAKDRAHMLNSPAPCSMSRQGTYECFSQRKEPGLSGWEGQREKGTKFQSPAAWAPVTREYPLLWTREANRKHHAGLPHPGRETPPAPGHSAHCSEATREGLNYKGLGDWGHFHENSTHSGVGILFVSKMMDETREFNPWSGENKLGALLM